MSQEHMPPAPVQSARRRLLGGSFSMPLALTLYSGASIASASSLRCVVNQNKPGYVLPSPPVASVTATYLRVQLYWDGVSAYWVRGQDLPTNRVLSLPSATQAQRFDITTNNFLAGSTPVSTPGGLSASSKFAALRVDATGLVVGVGTSTTSGSALYASCWNSFKLG